MFAARGTIGADAESNMGKVMLAQNSLLGWIGIGLIAGIFAKMVLPARDPGGIVVMILIGIAGALLAGYVAQSTSWQVDDGWQSYAAATVGAVLLLVLYRTVISRRSR